MAMTVMIDDDMTLNKEPSTSKPSHFVLAVALRKRFRRRVRSPFLFCNFSCFLALNNAAKKVCATGCDAADCLKYIF